MFFGRQVTYHNDDLHGMFCFVVCSQRAASISQVGHVFSGNSFEKKPDVKVSSRNVFAHDRTDSYCRTIRY